MQFTFYDAQGSIDGFTFITPGQNYTPCVMFDSGVASYSGFDLSITVSEKFLDIGNVEDE